MFQATRFPSWHSKEAKTASRVPGHNQYHFIRSKLLQNYGDVAHKRKILRKQENRGILNPQCWRKDKKDLKSGDVLNIPGTQYFFVLVCGRPRGAEREFKPPCERGTSLTAIDPVRGALLYTHQKRRMSPFCTPSGHVPGNHTRHHGRWP